MPCLAVIIRSSRHDRELMPWRNTFSISIQVPEGERVTAGSSLPESAHLGWDYSGWRKGGEQSSRREWWREPRWWCRSGGPRKMSREKERCRESRSWSWVSSPGRSQRRWDSGGWGDQYLTSPVSPVSVQCSPAYLGLSCIWTTSAPVCPGWRRSAGWSRWTWRAPGRSCRRRTRWRWGPLCPTHCCGTERHQSQPARIYP